jgi:hypothetical protein
MFAPQGVIHVGKSKISSVAPSAVEYAKSLSLLAYRSPQNPRSEHSSGIFPVGGGANTSFGQ